MSALDSLKKWSPVLATVALLGITAPTFADTNSTIHFSGAVAGPTFDVSASSIAPALASFEATEVSADGSVAVEAVAIAFTACRHCAAGAEVSIAAVSDTARAIGHAPNRDSRYHIDAAGGVIRFVPARAAASASAGRLYVVVASYL